MKMFLHEPHAVDLLWKHLLTSVLFADDVILLATSVISGVHSRGLLPSVMESGVQSPNSNVSL